MADQTFVGTPSLQQRLDNSADAYKAIAKAVMNRLRVAMPGIINSFDSVRQTVNVDIAVYDRIQPNLSAGIPTYSPQTGDVKIPTLLDVPLCIPRAGNFADTIPVVQGDECLVVFADMCINQWFDNGGFNNVQQVIRRHNLSDAFAILAPTSQPKKLADYSTTAREIRTLDGTQKISVQNDKIAIQGTEIDLQGLLHLTGTVSPSTGEPTLSLPITINGVSYKLMLQPG
jgi:hypothetical protein